MACIQGEASRLAGEKNHLYTNMTKYCKCNAFANTKAGGYYLPPYDDCTIEFLLDIFEGRKDVLKAKEVGHVDVPRLPELSVKNMLEEAHADPDISIYLPEMTPKRQLSREWLFSVNSPPV